jgi:hypothetical protein
MKVQDGSGWNCRARFRLLAVERGRDEHSDAHLSRVLQLQTYFRGAKVGIENWQDVIHAALEYLVGIGIEMDIGSVADAHGVEVIFVQVADDPDVREIGNGEGIRT